MSDYTSDIARHTNSVYSYAIDDLEKTEDTLLSRIDVVLPNKGATKVSVKIQKAKARPILIQAVGRGTLEVDARAITKSKSYKDLVKELRELATEE